MKNGDPCLQPAPGRHLRSAAQRAIVLALVVLLAGPSARRTVAEELDVHDLRELSLEELLSVKVSSASGIEEPLREAPAAMVVVTAEQIRQRGYTDLSEVLGDLPGFDNILTNGTEYQISYQRGYRTPFMQRTLFLVNGIVDNHLWSHDAFLSRQYPLTNIDRIEVLYGPAGAVYGPNAFLGVINVITKDARDLDDGETRFTSSLQYGDYESFGADAAARGRTGEFTYSVSARFFQSDEPGLDEYSDSAFSDEALLSDRTIWGGVLDFGHDGEPYGSYANRSDDWGVLGEIGYRDLSFGLIYWEIDEGYGPYYAFDHTQPNQSWRNDSLQAYVRHEAEAFDDFSVKTLLKHRQNRKWGGWAEAVPDGRAGLEDYSFVSISSWNSESDAWKVRQDYDYEVRESLRLTAGLKWERKDLNRAYDLCSYYEDAACSSGSNAIGADELDAHLGTIGNPDGSIGPEDLGAGVFHSSGPLEIQPGPLAEVPSRQRITTDDKGLYLQGIWDLSDWRFSAAVRVDDNSLYGTFVKPRASAIWQVTDEATVKLIYAEAFQEPAPLQLYGGWRGRAANPDLQPEEVQNLEAIFMYQQRYWLHDASVFYAWYDDVIKEEAENAGEREVFGVEYRGSYAFPNPIGQSTDVSGYLYYSFTDSRSSITYDQTQAAWVDDESQLGDIAPHKINAGINVPIRDLFNLNLRANYVSERKLYSRNPLRAQGRKIDDYLVFDLNLIYEIGAPFVDTPFALGLKVKNLFDEQLHHPGVEQADSGDDASERALGFHNSLIPQPGRSFLVTLRMAL